MHNYLLKTIPVGFAQFIKNSFNFSISQPADI